jgi:hypothetical protein
MSYVHDTHMQQVISPLLFHFVTGTWTHAAGNVAHTVVLQKSAAAETSTVTIPLAVPGNASNEKGSKIASIEIDYEILTAAATSITATVWKIARGADGAVAVATQVTATQDLTAATDAADVDQHALTVTITTPEYVDDDDYWFVELACVCAATTVLEFLGAQVNYTARM